MKLGYNPYPFCMKYFGLRTIRDLSDKFGVSFVNELEHMFAFREKEVAEMNEIKDWLRLQEDVFKSSHSNT